MPLNASKCSHVSIGGPAPSSLALTDGSEISSEDSTKHLRMTEICYLINFFSVDKRQIGLGVTCFSFVVVMQAVDWIFSIPISGSGEVNPKKMTSRRHRFTYDEISI